LLKEHVRNARRAISENGPAPNPSENTTMRPAYRLTAAFAVMGGVLAAAIAAADSPSTTSMQSRAESIRHGRYLVQVSGCNDCHTPGYIMTDGATPEKDWLTGDALGWQGPWGTTYAPNLRLRLNAMSEDQWVEFVKTAQLRPPMPWFNLRAMTEADLRDIHRYVVAMGSAGHPAPAYLPPGLVAQGPVVAFPAPPKGAAK
jgi:mono/diheme cytochrome c family protein